MRKPGISFKKLVGMSMTAALVIAVTLVSAFGAGTVDVTSTLTTSFQTVIDDCLSMIGSILPVALTVFGVSMAVGFGIKWFKKIIGKA